MQALQAAKAAGNLNPGVMKEPRGFIKVIQFILAIFAFATATGNTAKYVFDSVDCKDITYDVGYPYKLDGIKVDVSCTVNSTQTTMTLNPYGNYSPPSEFYVFVGVMAFLNCIGVVILYVFFDDTYRKNDLVPTVDFVVSAVFTALWLISASAFADGVRHVKLYANPERLRPDPARVTLCGKNFDKCHVTTDGNYATLDVSILFGFLNLIVWGGSLWFLWKETKWFKARQGGDAGGMSGVGSPSAPTPTGDQPQI